MVCGLARASCKNKQELTGLELKDCEWSTLSTDCAVSFGRGLLTVGGTAWDSAVAEHSSRLTFRRIAAVPPGAPVSIATGVAFRRIAAVSPIATVSTVSTNVFKQNAAFVEDILKYDGALVS
jgi:hypothetical protein